MTPSHIYRTRHPMGLLLCAERCKRERDKKRALIRLLRESFKVINSSNDKQLSHPSLYSYFSASKQSSK